MRRPQRPPPLEFRDQFVAHGWRHVEHIYGARTDTIRKWLFMVGLGDEVTRAEERRGLV